MSKVKVPRNKIFLLHLESKIHILWEGKKFFFEYLTQFWHLISNVKGNREISSNFCGLFRKPQLYIQEYFDGLALRSRLAIKLAVQSEELDENKHTIQYGTKDIHRLLFHRLPQPTSYRLEFVAHKKPRYSARHSPIQHLESEAWSQFQSF